MFKLQVCVLNGSEESWMFIDTFDNRFDAVEEGERYLSYPNHIDYVITDIDA